MAKVEMYVTMSCPYCLMARQLLRGKGVMAEEIRIDQDVGQRATMIARSKRQTVPQIFIDDRHIGGFDDLDRLEARGELDALLAGATHD